MLNSHRIGWMVVFCTVLARRVVTARAFQTASSSGRSSFVRGGASAVVTLRDPVDIHQHNVDASSVPSASPSLSTFPPSSALFAINGSGRDQAGPSSSSSSSSNNAGPSDEPRTGWLHNTESPSVRRQKAAAAATRGSSNSPPITSEARRRLERAMKEQEQNHRIICPPTFHACGGDRTVVVTEHKISVPVFREGSLSSSAQTFNASARIDVFFTIVEQVKTADDEQWWKSLGAMNPMQRARVYIAKAAMKDADDMLLYLQGGPGFGAPTPVVGLGLGAESSWAGKALSKYSRIVLMDQRGTGRSTPVTKQSLQKRFPDLFILDGQESIDSTDSNEESVAKMKDALVRATDFVAQFRADNIVQDAEFIREALLLPVEEEGSKPPRPYGGCLGQSFGGFCILTYLSQIARPPKVCLLTGGIGPMTTSAYDLYTSLWQRVKERSLRYYEMYPSDVAAVKKIVKTLLDKPADLPSGGKLTARRFLQEGLSLGGSPSAFASMHSLVSTAFLDTDDDTNPEFTKKFLKTMDNAAPFDEHPFYFLLHESIYGDGPEFSPTGWAADRAYQDLLADEQSGFDFTVTSRLTDDNDKPTLFFGEMVFPWMADGDFAELSGLGMKSLANALATKEDWGPLYDVDRIRAALRDGSITRAAAAVYFDDMYVDFDCCRELTKRGGPLEKCKVWISNDYQHSGLRDNGAAIFNKLHGMATGSVRTPS